MSPSLLKESEQLHYRDGTHDAAHVFARSESSNQRHSTSDEISLLDLFAGFWRQRRLLIGGLLLTALCLLGLAAFLIGISGDKLTARLGFKLHFPGVLDNQYPNGSVFRTSDIISPTVMEQVFDNLGLESSMDLASFRQSVSVIEANDAMGQLQQEFQAKLSNAKLTGPERRALEEEFASKRKAARNGSFALILHNEQLLTRLPAEQVDLILNSILNTYAREAEETRGVYLYPIDVLSPNILNREELEQEDYLIAIDILRALNNRALANIEKLQGLPGAHLMRTAESKLSLEEVRTQLKDLLRFKIEPLMGMVRHTASFRNNTLSRIYLENQLFNLNMEAKAATQKGHVIDEALAAYRREAGEVSQVPAGLNTGTVIPQINEGFLDRLVEMSSQDNDVEFRQSLTQQALAYRIKQVDIEQERQIYESLLSERSPTAAESSPEMIDQAIAYIINHIERGLRSITEIHRSISSHNLQPSQAFTILEPTWQQHARSISFKHILAICFGLGFLAAAALLLVAVFRESQQK